MTPREELIQAIETSPDDVISVLLRTLKGLHQEPERAVPGVSSEDMTVEKSEQISERLREKNGFLVIETEGVSAFDINAFIREMREERIQSQIDRTGL